MYNRTRTLAQIEASSRKVMTQVDNTPIVPLVHNTSEFPKIGSKPGPVMVIDHGIHGMNYHVPSEVRLRDTSNPTLLDVIKSAEVTRDVEDSEYVPNLTRRAPVVKSAPIMPQLPRERERVLPDPRWSWNNTPVCDRNPGVWSQPLNLKKQKLSNRKLDWVLRVERGSTEEWVPSDIDFKRGTNDVNVNDDADVVVQGKTQWGGVETATLDDERTNTKKSATPIGKQEFATT